MGAPRQLSVQLTAPFVLLLRRQVVPLAALFFCASFNLTILANLKDALVITAGGAEMLPFLSTYVVLPLSLGFFSLYSKLCDRVPPRHVFYYTICTLLATYVAFVAVYPFHQQLHPTVSNINPRNSTTLLKPD
jgi:AAA family ATP:ADP antiporter